MFTKLIETKNKTKFTRRELLIGFATLLVIAATLLFPQKTYGEIFWLSFLFLTIFPILVIGFLLEEPLNNFGFSLGKIKMGIIFSTIVIILFVLVNYFLLYQTKYGGELSVARFIVDSFIAFLMFELFLSLPLHFFWEFFFRGFIQFGLEKKMGIFSLFLAAGLQTLLFFRNSWPTIFLILFSSLAAGLIANRSRSVFYSAITLWIISVSLDIMIIRIVHQITD